MSQTDEEKIRKIYAKDLKVGDTVHTVFRAVGKDKVTSRAGKTFLTLSLVDKTGEVDSRVFDNVENVETSFADDDYLLVKGKVIAFHGKPQLVLDSVERLDPGPIDAKEFAYTAPAAAEAAPKHEKQHEAPAPKGGGHRALKQRILELIDDPKVAQGLDALLRHLDSYIDERVQMALRNGGGSHPPRGEKKPQVDKRPRVEFKARQDHDKAPEKEKSAPPRDPSLPKDLTFKPLSMLAGEPAVSAAESSPKPETGN